ncbi:hypothetical protein F4820DRAFT_226029 [Hypoxylon rubiginosum]|uniref:Uncharacterized protein n=1 Tax=Hypoxylon rubiginosum TaxID=110542 RepID=A0ACB9Z6Z1_9PEZI|nr:hypothetical protein F4820DRAFT_226029 [Hypoxylon rubiginosum]
MSALFNFQSLLLVILLLICTCAYVHQIFPTILDRNKQGLMGIFWKAARVGERLSPYISLCCVFMAVSSLWLLIMMTLANNNQGLDVYGQLAHLVTIFGTWHRAKRGWRFGFNSDAKWPSKACGVQL